MFNIYDLNFTKKGNKKQIDFLKKKINQQKF